MINEINEFDRLFCSLPPSLMRNEDGTITVDKSHPAVKEILASILECQLAGDSEETIRYHVMRGFEEGLRRIREEEDGR